MRILAGVIVTLLAVGGCSSAPAASQSGQGAWHVAYTGYGHVHSGDRSFVLEPARPKSATTTHSALVLSAHGVRDFVLVVRLRTISQLRMPRPNDWEVGWLLWHYANERHFYYLILKPNGFELGKEDPAYPGQQRFLVTGKEPAFPPERWYVVQVIQRGDVISVSVNGRGLVRYADTSHPYSSGLVGLYAEDAVVAYHIVDLKPTLTTHENG